MNETDVIPVSQISSEPVFTLLFVDDEANILASLKRLFRPFGYHIFTAESAAQGLEILAQETIDLVVSDMRMPEMNGAQFLEKVRQKWPETMRILLTGYAEICATIDAINKGQIYRYISKPWEDNDIILLVERAGARVARAVRPAAGGLRHRLAFVHAASNAAARLRVPGERAFQPAFM